MKKEKLDMEKIAKQLGAAVDNEEPLAFSVEVDEGVLAEKVQEFMYSKAFEGLLEEVFGEVIKNKKFLADLKKKVAAEMNKQLDERVKEFVEGVRLEV